MRIAVTGAGGRLGSALVEALTGGGGPIAAAGAIARAGSIAGAGPIALEAALPGVQVDPWSRSALDLDRPETTAAVVRERRPDLVIHCAAWTDVDGCARDPETAILRNGVATAALAEACHAAGADLVYISTNEVFDGSPADGRPYAEDDPASPANPYGLSKRLGEEGVIAAYEGIGLLLRAEADVPPPAANHPPAAPGSASGSPGTSHTPGASGSPAGGEARPSARTGPGPRAWIVRTAWLYGPPGPDFPMKILAAAVEAARTGRPLRLVSDEIGSPTRAADLAQAIVALIAGRPASGIVHLVNAGLASRAEWAETVLAATGLVVPIDRVPASDWQRASNPPRWGVLGTGRAATLGLSLRDWREALEDEMPRYRAFAAAQQAPG